MIAVQQVLLNWKIKSLFFASSRLSIYGIYWVRFDGLSFTNFLGQITTIIFCCILLYDSEQTMMDVYFQKEENRKEKVKWMSIMDTLPIFVMIFDKCKQQVTYINQHFKSTFFKKIFKSQLLISLLSHK